MLAAKRAPSAMHIVDMVYFWARTMPQRPAVIQPDGIITYRALAQAIRSRCRHFARNIPDKSKPVAVSLSTRARRCWSRAWASPRRLQHRPSHQALFEHLASHRRQHAGLRARRRHARRRTNILFDDTWLSYGDNRRAAGQANLPGQAAGRRRHYLFHLRHHRQAEDFVQTQKAWDQRMLFPSTTTFANFERALIVPGLASSYGFTRAYETLYARQDRLLRAIWQADALARQHLRHRHDHRLDPAGACTCGYSGEGHPLPACVAEDSEHRRRQSFRARAFSGSRTISAAMSSSVTVRPKPGSMAMAPYDMIADIPGAVGFVVPEVEVEIVDAGRPRPADRRGGLRAGANTAVYHELAQAESAPMPGSIPGDLGWLTEDGVLCIAGRTGDVINRGGVKLSVTDFENFLLSCPGVKDAGVCTFMGGPASRKCGSASFLSRRPTWRVFRQTIESNTQFGSNIDKLFVVEAIPRGATGQNSAR